MDEAAYDDALIDEFDSPALVFAPPQRPLLSAQSLRHCAMSPAAAVCGGAAGYERGEQQPTPAHSRAGIGALYPSFVALGSETTTTIASAMAEYSLPATAPPATVAAAPLMPHYQHQQPQSLRSEHLLASDASPPPSAHPSSYAPLFHRFDSHRQSLSQSPRQSPRQSQPPQPPQPQLLEQTLTRSAPPRSTPTTADALPTHPLCQPHMTLEPAQEPHPVRESEPVAVLSQREIDSKQREIEQELAGYQQQLDYLAHALAGDTPHQIAERKRRERERQEREHQRAVATELRVAHQIERLHEREQRRDKVLSRGSRASRSPSPDERGIGNVSDEQDTTVTDTAL